MQTIISVHFGTFIGALLDALRTVNDHRSKQSISPRLFSRLRGLASEVKYAATFIIAGLIMRMGLSTNGPTLAQNLCPTEAKTATTTLLFA